jgi:Fe-S cluster biosynthesis and repair protein YggX
MGGEIDRWEPPRHVFGENPGEELVVHDSTRQWNEQKAIIMAEEKQALAALAQRHKIERDEVANIFRDRYREAAAAAGFR